jgi:hypothetical protein
MGVQNALSKIVRSVNKNTQPVRPELKSLFRMPGFAIHTELPEFELKFSVAVDYFEIGTVIGDEPGAVRSSRERDE